MSGRRPKIRLAALVVALALAPNSLWACAACYGQSDSPMAKGMNWGIASLLGVVVTVLGGIAASAVFLARRSAALAAARAPEEADASGPAERFDAPSPVTQV